MPNIILKAILIILDFVSKDAGEILNYECFSRIFIKEENRMDYYRFYKENGSLALLIKLPFKDKRTFIEWILENWKIEL